MNFEPVERIARALLYEGYLLYPYRPSSLKNLHRWTFGCLFPADWSRAHGETEPWAAQTQCLILGGEATMLTVKVCFLQLVPGQEAVEREVLVEGINLGHLA